MEPADSVAFIGRNPGDENVYVCTGDSGHGLTHGTIAGLLITDLVHGRQNAWLKLYDPSRKPLRAIGEYARENLNVARQYVDLVTGGDVKDPDQVPHGEGAVLRRGLDKIACFRDPSGSFYEMSAICPHLGCVVEWNTTEKTWDYPCHGSRFTSMGKVVNGPALTDLKALDGVDDGVRPVPVAG